jgi:hypothetical protein
VQRARRAEERAGRWRSYCVHGGGDGDMKVCGGPRQRGNKMTLGRLRLLLPVVAARGEASVCQQSAATLAVLSHCWKSQI